MTTISATEVKNRFGAVLRTIKRGGEPLLIERSGQTVAVIMSIETYERAFARRLPLANDDLALIESAFGMWQNREDIDDTWLSAGRQQWQSEWRNE